MINYRVLVEESTKPHWPYLFVFEFSQDEISSRRWTPYPTTGEFHTGRDRLHWEITNWCRTTLGNYGATWLTQCNNRNIFVWFNDPANAALFKLTHS